MKFNPMKTKIFRQLLKIYTNSRLDYFRDLTKMVGSHLQIIKEALL